MLKIKTYETQITDLHNQGYSAIEISKKLNFKYHQPIYNYFKKMGWKRLSKEEYPQYKKYQVNQNFFYNIDSEEKAYILGFICADGNVSIPRYSISITVQQTDIDILKKIQNAMCSNHPIKEHIQRENPYKKSNRKTLEQAHININGKTLVSPLVDLGIYGKKTYSLNGTEIEVVPKHLIRHFLRGYFDGDGNILWEKEYSSGKKYIINICGNKDFLENTFQKYFPSTNAMYKDKYSKQCWCWKISDKQKVLKFLCYLYDNATIYLDRKYKTYRYALWSYKTGLIAGNSYFIDIIKGQSAANPLVKSWRQVQRLMDETFSNPFEEEYNSNTNSQHLI